jgi:lipopolysaccharide/colanic/teichoic acid biosynthesis glycosyltransferase
MLLFVYAPLLGFIAIAIYIDSAESALLSRTLKVDGRPDVQGFVFRTTRRSDRSRQTPLGTFLHNSGLDRLPRLLSILWGRVPLAVVSRQPDRKNLPAPERD